ncbi:MAG: LysR family transcriptional regulator [Gammaproteobacteria bacterium]|nr:LysR family transcriptional regulator [Gammaproteobacteria bacterium]
MDREDWGSLAAFAVVAEERSFTRAATRLGVSPSALSHTLRRLEERVRIRLLARSTRSVSTTEAGERLLARLGPALEAIANAVEDLGRLLDRPSGHVRITTSRSAARMVVAPVLPRFTQAYPEIVLEIVIDPGLTNIVAQRFDAGIRLGESLDKDVVAVPVSGPQRMAVVGAPQYFASRPPPATPHDLRTHRCINFRLPSPAPGTLYKWEFEKAHHSIELAVEGPLIFDDEGMVVDAALAGVGLGYVIEEQVAPLLQAGELVRVLEDWCPPFPGFFLYYPGRRQLSPALAAFIDTIRVPARRERRR